MFTFKKLIPNLFQFHFVTNAKVSGNSSINKKDFEEIMPKPTNKVVTDLKVILFLT